MDVKYTTEILRNIQLIQLDILLEIDRICKEHKIKYFLSSGTLLGAIRHRGFIPWDDDIDIDMMRPDYERFLEIAKKELSSDLFIQNYITDKYCLNLGFSKVRKNGTIHESEGQRHLTRHKGISIDIFPIDVVPQNHLKRKFHKQVISFIHKLNSMKLKYNFYNEKLIRKIIIILGSIFLLPIPVVYLGSIMEKAMKFYGNSNSTLVSNTYSKNYYDVCTFNKEIYGEPILIEFEGYKFPVPEKWKTYLENIYGDYMELPPENKRFNFQHSIIKAYIGGNDN